MKRTKANCKYCGKELTKTYMIKHLATCKEREMAESKVAGIQKVIYTLLIEELYYNQYWMMIEVSEDMKLSGLDQFLRDIWLECCGHLSSFKIDGTHYDLKPVNEFLYKSKSMNVKLSKVLSSGKKFIYEYDFGSTTYLRLEVISRRIGVMDSKMINIMARNKMTEIECEYCESHKASFLLFEDYSVTPICHDCEKGIDDEEVNILPLVNSPRCGVCGYEGSAMYPND